MATFHERLQAYHQHPEAQKFSKKQIHRLHNNISWVFNRNRPGFIHKYVQVQEAGQTLWVRDYPHGFTATIDGLINRLHYKIAAQQPPKQRKRIPAKPKPVWRVPSTSK